MSSTVQTQQTLDVYVNNFVFDRMMKGRTTGTVEYYRSELALFFNWANVQKVEDITADLLRKYFVELAQRRNKGGVHCSFRAVRAFINWYDAEYEPGWKNPAQKVKLPPQRLAPLPEIPLDDIQKLIEVCDGKLRLRDVAILKCLVDTGCRASEFLALNYGDVNLTTGAVHIRHGKGDKARITWMGNNARRALMDYLATRDGIQEDAPLWLNDNGVRFRFYGLRELIKRLCQRAGVPHRGLHAFRRTFGISLYRKGIDILTISRLLGHSNIEVTKRYLNINNEDLREAHSRASPADSLE